MLGALSNLKAISYFSGEHEAVFVREKKLTSDFGKVTRIKVGREKSRYLSAKECNWPEERFEEVVWVSAVQ